MIIPKRTQLVGARLDYLLDFSRYLAKRAPGDTLDTITLTCPNDDLVIEPKDSQTDSTAMFWFSSEVAGKFNIIANVTTTPGNRNDYLKLTLVVEER